MCNLQHETMNTKKHVVMIANSGFTILNFREELIHALIQNGARVSVICPQHCSLMGNRNTSAEIKKTGATHLPVKMTRTGTNPLAEAMIFFRMFKVLKRAKPDVIVTYTVKANIYGCLIGRLTSNARLIANVTGIGSIFSNDDIKSKVISIALVPLYRIALAKTSKVIFQNKSDRVLFENHKIISSNQGVIVPGSGVNIEKFTRTSFKSQPISFIFVGRLLKDKGVLEYLAAAAKIKKDFNDILFGLLGEVDQHYKSISIRQIKQFEDDGIIRWEQRSNKVWEVLDRYTIFVLPSYREGLTKSGLEALSMSMPLILSNVPGCRELVKQGVNGYLVKSKCQQSLEKAMREMIRQKDKIQRMGSESRRIAETHYASNLIVAKLLDIIL